MEETIQNLLNYFDKIFSLENLEKSAYYVHKLSENLNLRLQDVQQDRNVKEISKIQEEIVAALQKCSKVSLKQDQGTLTLNVPLKQILALNIPEGVLTEEFKNFVQTFLPQTAEVNITEDQDSLNLRFKNEQDVINFHDQLENDEKFIFQGKNIDIQIQQEKVSDVYTHLKNSVMKKSHKYQNNNSNYVNPNMVNGQSAPGQQKNDFDLQNWQQSYIEFQIQNMLMYQDAQLLNINNLTHLSQPQDYSDLYIRRAKNDRVSRKNLNYQAQDFDPLNPFFSYNRNKKRGHQERGRQMNRRNGAERTGGSKNGQINVQNSHRNNNQNNNNAVQQNRNKSNRRRSRNNIKSDKQNKPVKNNTSQNKKVTSTKPTNKPLNILDDDENVTNKSNRQRSSSKKQKEVYIKNDDISKPSQEKSKEVFIKKEVAEKLNLTNKEEAQKDQNQQQNKVQEVRSERTKSVSFSQNQPNAHHYKKEQHSVSKSKRKESQEVQYQPKNTQRPRADSKSFEPLIEKTADGVATVYYSRKQSRTRSHSKQNELKVPSNNEPYVETREKIDRQYNKSQIIDSFERWKLQKQQHPKVTQLIETYKTTPIPVISTVPQIKLEVEFPFRENSQSVTPLLKNVQNPASYRKGSGTLFNITQSPAINSKAKPSTRKYSSKN